MIWTHSVGRCASPDYQEPCRKLGNPHVGFVFIDIVFRTTSKGMKDFGRGLTKRGGRAGGESHTIWKWDWNQPKGMVRIESASGEYGNPQEL